ncbi:hypothetical protein DESPIG_02279 [Desulfovibrio piger ATCC 29098]|uniref:Uncharacterized protein n=1 Tax=Desulfovibrio piger ATCC 29098 TaxID=411464 RepID=B6WW11_9BACT|nr:hypothetical protein DESPIG_02279 [Desulfovibrio piger ATCC 29098]
MRAIKGKGTSGKCSVGGGMDTDIRPPGGGLFVYQLYSIQTHDKNKGKHKIKYFITYCYKIFF